ncbi:MAG: glycosyltransferase N-terminal domain-containing protein, partial [bacterium]
MIGRGAGAVLAWAYGALGTLGVLLASPVLAWFALHPGQKGDQWRERLGRLPRGVPRGAVWIHAASVGEVTALGPLLRELRRLRRPPRVVLSVMTVTGRARARALYREPAVLAPLDVPPCARWWAFAAAPRALLVMETELWPARIAAAAAVAPVAWVNGRLSDRSYPWYRLGAPLVGRLFGRMRRLGVIGPEDARRAIALGAPARRVTVCGNLKVDSLEA